MEEIKRTSSSRKESPSNWIRMPIGSKYFLFSQKIFSNETKISIRVSRTIGSFLFKEAGVISDPDFYDPKITENTEAIVLASDGLWDVMGNQDVIDFVLEKKEEEMNATEISQALVDLAIERGTSDNTTVLVVLFDHNK